MGITVVVTLVSVAIYFRAIIIGASNVQILANLKIFCGHGSGYSLVRAWVQGGSGCRVLYDTTVTVVLGSSGVRSNSLQPSYGLRPDMAS